jgi:hypothetical protein
MARSVQSKAHDSMGGAVEVNNGKDTLFWEDVWLGEVPLKMNFPQIYSYCADKQCTVSDCWERGSGE